MNTPARTRSTITWPVVAVATLLALLAAVAVLFMASDGDADDTPRSDGSVELRPEDAVPSGDPADIAFRRVEGGESTIGDQLAGRPAVVNFFAEWCTPCIAEMPDFQAVSKELDGRVDFIGLAVQDRPEDSAEIIDDTGVTYPWFRDPRGDVLASTGAVQMPTTAFFDADGNMTEVHSGQLDADELRSMIDEHLGVSA